MTEPKFTPGPWHIGYGKTVETFGSGDFFAIGLKTEPDWKAICLLSPADSVNDTDKANAHLIAAAPDLYDAAQAVVERWDSPLWKDLPHTAEYIHKLRSALAKARGEG